ncbi:Heme-binding protein A precursor [Roseivivax jejudonensis]|uniref:Heme-binding protein A n=1 Tax=Roseivivax jejudonensis TaxID=1529041 RepID=A0A1X6YUF3_9RHOB|nr:ABC transporter substrate-binding protein [Roseivivax jejudonensis]SLN31532.1 Heme-binding protein A precursor [Roseivivax jejudonensis]
MSLRRGHRALPGLVRALGSGTLSRREFMTHATALGVTASVANAVAGRPADAQETARPARRAGGTLRIQQDVRPLKDPRTFDWSEIANVTRGWLEYLVEYRNDGSLRGMLLSDWEANDDATGYTLWVREGVTWSDGTTFTADDVARMFEYWCDASVEGNVMAASLSALVDPVTNKLRAGSVVVEDGAVRLILPRPDATLIVSLADYPAAVVPPGFDAATMLEDPVGTGPFRPEHVTPGESAALVRAEDHRWWGEDLPEWGPATLDRIEFVDLGTDPSTWIDAIENERVDMLYENVGRFVEAADALGWERYETPTAATVVLRGNQQAEVGGATPYADIRVREALTLATDNAICLELGYGGRGEVAANDHVAPIQPDHADLGPARFDPDAARQRVIQAGLQDFEHRIVTLDDGVARRTGAAIEALLLDAGIPATQEVLPGSRFWAEWKSFPLSITEWNHRPLGVQTLALGYRTGAVWNESGYANPDFDAALDRALAIAEPEARAEVMAELQGMLRANAVIVQPYWRSLIRHARPDVVGAEMHPAFEIHLYRLGFSA